MKLRTVETEELINLISLPFIPTSPGPVAYNAAITDFTSSGKWGVKKKIEEYVETQANMDKRAVQCMWVINGR